MNNRQDASRTLRNLFSGSRLKRRSSKFALESGHRPLIPHKLVLKLIVWCAILLPSIGQLASAQQVIVHSAFSYTEDGVSPYDADGVKNGVVVWKGGAVHVTNGHYIVKGPYDFVANKDSTSALQIQPGAIVKIAGEFVVDANGRVTRWFPGTFGPGLQAIDGSTIQIEGAIFTDIRDDAEGGDTNQDGTASVPSTTFPSYWIHFGGTANEYIRGNSKIKYASLLTHLGSMDITKNIFEKFGGITPYISSGNYLSNYVVPAAAPKISGNKFEIVTSFGGPGALDLRGTSPIVDDNKFSGTGTAVIIGPSWEDYFRRGSAPRTGTTIITNNTIECKNGIWFEEPSGGDTLLARVRFKADIRGNKLRGTGALDGSGVRLRTAADVTFTGNEISNYAIPLNVQPGTGAFFFDNLLTVNDLRINNNRFSLEGTGNFAPDFDERAWKKGVFVNAKNNYWGDPTGPFDNSNVDGFYNPRGRGVRIGNGFDYLPFIGGTAPPPEDGIHINVISNPPKPLNAGAGVTVNVAVDYYDLKSASTGKIVVLLRDADGQILNQPGESVNVTSAGHSANIPPIGLTVPDLTNVITVEASLVPDGNGENVQSNVEPLAVRVPPSEFNIGCVTDADGLVPCVPPIPIRGNRIRAKVQFTYTFTQGSVHAEVDIKERVVGTGQVLTDYPLITFTVPPAINGTDEKLIELDIPLHDVLIYPKTELYVKFSAKDDAGNTVGKGSIAVPILASANYVRFSLHKELKVGPVLPGDPNGNYRSFFVAGELPTYVGIFNVRVATRNVTNWQVQMGDDKALDKDGKILYSYTASGPALENVSTGPERQATVKIIGQNPIPSGTRKLRVFVKLLGAGITVAVDSLDVLVNDPPVQTVQKSVPTGASQVAFSPIPVTLGFSSNQTPGLGIAQEYGGQFNASAAVKKSSVLAAATDYYWKFIPLNRYWAVYDTLKDGTFSATVSFTYNPSTDFPSTPGFKEDSLVLAGLSHLSNTLEALPSTLNKATHTITTAYTKLFDTWVVASKATVPIVTEVSSEGGGIPERFSLEQNYPNPFNPRTIIEFSVPRASHVDLKVFNLLGQEVTTLFSGELAPNSYKAEWGARSVASGVYFYRLIARASHLGKTEEFVETKKMLMLR